MRWDVNNCSSTCRQLYLAYWKYDSFEYGIWSLEETNRRRTIFQIFWNFISLWDTYSISVFFPLTMWLADSDCTVLIWLAYPGLSILRVSANSSVSGHPLHSPHLAGGFGLYSPHLAGGSGLINFACLCAQQCVGSPTPLSSFGWRIRTVLSSFGWRKLTLLR